MEGALDLSAKLQEVKSTAENRRPPALPHLNLGLDITPKLDLNISQIASTPSMTLPTSKDPTPSPTAMRPFKMYPFEPLNGLYSHLASQASALGSPGLYPFGATPGLSPTLGPSMSMLDTAIAMQASSPVSQYLHSKKRRIDSRSSSYDSVLESSHDSIALNRDSDKRESMNAPKSPTKEPKSPVKTSPHINVETQAIPKQKDVSKTAESDTNPKHYIPQRSELRDELTASAFSTEQMLHNTHLPHSANPEDDDQADTLSKSPLPPRGDGHYWDRRRKNNEAAKRSRDARRIKEEEIALRAAYLEQENLKLRAQVAILKNETSKLHFMLYNR